jgi:RNA polymerase sigma factor (sigma-70 family)
MMEEYTQLVLAARQGDDDAFGRLVHRFQDMAYFKALSVTGNSQLAREAAQEAFLDAYHSLPKLRKAAAFPAWFKRIIFKHAERQIRGQRPSLIPLEAAPDLSQPSPGPEGMLVQWQQQEMVRTAVRSLPDAQRQAVDLFYLRNLTLAESAAMLDVPISTVKKRLFDARQNLKGRISPMTTPYKPSQDEQFEDRINFFIALKHNNLIQLRQLLRRSPDLLEVQTEWGVASDGWYWPLGVTAIHLAAGTGNLSLLDLLVEMGADVNAADRHGNRPLDRAAHMGQVEAVRRLLELGAGPTIAGDNGRTPLHTAVIRRRKEVVQLLLQHGAGQMAADANGRTPLDWARIKGLPGIAQQLGGSAQPPAATAPPDTGPAWQTGLKIIDLLAPLKWGGRNGLFTPISGIGFDVLLAELIYNFGRYQSGHTIQAGLARGDFTAESRRLWLRNTGVEDNVSLIFGKSDDSPARRQHLVRQAIEAAEKVAAVGRPVLFTIYTDLALSDGVQEMVEKLAGDSGETAVTLLYLGGHSLGAEPSALTGLDAALTFDRWRAREGLWPAIDSLRAYSHAFMDEAHRDLARRSRRLLARYVDLAIIYENQGLDGFDMALYEAADKTAVIRARRLHYFLAQPLTVAEPWTMRPAEYIPLADTMTIAADILNGRFDDTPESDLAYTGSWSPKWT